MKGEKGLAYAAFLTVCFIWGTTYLAIAVAIETLPTFLFAGSRFFLAGLILLGIRLMAGDTLPRRLADWGSLALIGFLMVGVGNVAVVWAERYVSSGFAALLVATSPLWMTVMERFRRAGDRLGPLKIAGMVVGFAGVVILVLPELDGSEIGVMFLAGVLVLQLGVIGWDLGSMISKYRPAQTSALSSAAIQMLTGGAIVTVIGLVRGELPEFYFNGRTLTAYLYLLIFGSVLTYGAYVYALSKLKTTTVALYAYINPAVAVFLGWLILDEQLGWNAIAAMVVIFAGVALVQAGGMRPTAQPRVAPAIGAEEAAAAAAVAENPADDDPETRALARVEG